MDETQIESDVHNLIGGAESLAQEVVAKVESEFVDVNKAVVSALGHVHNLISNLSGAQDLSNAKASVEAAILSFVKHLGL